MSLHGVEGSEWLNEPSAAAPALARLGYLRSGPELAELHRRASDTAKALSTGKSAQVGMTFVAADPVISAIWGDQKLAALFASALVSTMIAKEREKPYASRLSVTSLLSQLPYVITDAMKNKGDPASCKIEFERSLALWSSVYPALPNPSKPGTWCSRDLVLVPGHCEVYAICAMTTDASGKDSPILVNAPPAGAVTSATPPTTKTPVRPPTHAQVDAQIQQKIRNSGKSFDQLEAIAELTELATYMNALAQARVMFAMALGLPTNAPDAALFSALEAKGIEPAEALDWFVGCDADLDCYRQKLNAAIGSTDTASRNNRTKSVVALGALGAAAVTFFMWRRAR